jgi:hypothetical protein
MAACGSFLFSQAGLKSFARWTPVQTWRVLALRDLQHVETELSSGV